LNKSLLFQKKRLNKISHPTVPEKVAPEIASHVEIIHDGLEDVMNQESNFSKNKTYRSGRRYAPNPRSDWKRGTGTQQ
jgi:hypothetical protein